jgi:hypothetical protein
MNLFLCSTTIHTPLALKMMRACYGSGPFVVAGDHKTPREAYEMVLSLDNTSVCLPESGHKWKCSEAIGFNTLSRRNIAFLEALAQGADAIIAWDTDNYPLDTAYFAHFDRIMANPFNGIKIDGKDGWFDPGQYLVPHAAARGFPMQRKHRPHYAPVTDAKVGMASGLIINEPDIDAITRMVQQPVVGDVALLAQTGCVVDPHTWTVANTQNTCVIRELIPAWFLAPGVGRMDDIYAGLVVQRVARERGYHVHFGQPFVLQERHDHDLLVDLHAEIAGYSNVIKMADLLDSILLVGRNVVADVRVIYSALAHASWYPPAAVTAAMAWLEDVEGVL